MSCEDQIRDFVPRNLDGAALEVGFRSGSIGTHTSRTIMMAELAALFESVPPAGSRADLMAAVTEANCLGKRTASTRKLTFQRLSELYVLDPAVPIFRVLRRLWSVDEVGRPLLALLCALARDPLLMATAASVLSLAAGEEFRRDRMRLDLIASVGERFNESILDKVVRNAASSWAQSGHLEGRTFKKRRIVQAMPAATAFALYLGYAAGFRGTGLFGSGWCRTLDCSPALAQDLALAAKRAGLIDLRISREVVDLDLRRLDPGRTGG